MCTVSDDKFIIASSQDYQDDYRFSFSHQDINQGYEVLLCWIDQSCNYGSLWIYLKIQTVTESRKGVRTRICIQMNVITVTSPNI